MIERDEQIERAEMYLEAVEILDQAKILRDTAIWQDQQVEKFIERYPNEKLDLMDWESKEKFHKESELLLGRLNQSVKDLQKLGQRYNKARERARKLYGKDVLPPTTGFSIPDMDSGEVEL
jgi:hypothetical protein